MAGSPRNAAVGLIYTTNSPQFAGSSDAVVGTTVGGVGCSTTTSFSGLGITLTPPPTLASGAYDWSQLTGWQFVDDWVAHMRAEGCPLKMVTIFSAPFFMLNNPNGDSVTTISNNLTAYGVASSWFNAFGDYVHYIVNRYLRFGVMYYCIWGDADGFTNNGRIGYEANTQMYNAAWAAVKADTFTAQANVGGPAFKMVVQQNGYNYGSSYNSTPVCQSSATPGTAGSWGEVDPNVTDGFAYFNANATGYDFLVARVDPSDVSGGGPNPNNLTYAQTSLYFRDVSSWLTTNITNGVNKPLMLKCPAGFDFTTINQAIVQAGQGGADMFMFSGTGTVVDYQGKLADCGPSVNTYTAANPPNSLLAPPKIVTMPSYFPGFVPAAGSVIVSTPSTPGVRNTGTGDLNVTTTAPNTFTVSLSQGSSVANNDLLLACGQFSGSGADYQTFTSTNFTSVALVNNVANIPSLQVLRYAGAPATSSISVKELANGGGGGFVGAALAEITNVDSSTAAQVLYTGYSASLVSSFTVSGASTPNQTGQLWWMAVTWQNSINGNGHPVTCDTPSGWTAGPAWNPTSGGNPTATFYMVGGSSAPSVTLSNFNNGGTAKSGTVSVIIIGLKPSA